MASGRAERSQGLGKVSQPPASGGRLAWLATALHPGNATFQAASPTLPLGTQAKVTNQETGQTAHVTVNDRGPYAEDRILDLTPKAAEKLGITKEDGVAEVKVEPTHVPKKAND